MSHYHGEAFLGATFSRAIKKRSYMTHLIVGYSIRSKTMYE